MEEQKAYEAEPLEGYENMEFEAKNATKYLSTFPFPYMNGKLHLGKHHNLLNTTKLSRLFVTH